MIKVQNLSTSEVINVLNVVVENGRIISEARRPHKGARFYTAYPMMQAAGESEDGRDLHTLADGWELATKGTRKPRQPKQEESVVSPQVEVRELGGEPVEVVHVEEVVEEVTEQAKAENVTAEKVWEKLEKETNKTKQEVLGSAAEIASEFVDPEVIRMELAAKYGSMGADMFEAVMKIAGIVKPAVVSQPQEATVNESDVERIVSERMEQWAQNGRNMTKTIEVVTPRGSYTVNGRVNKDFAKFCNLVNAGKPLYMYGPAGSGKSYTAKQIADSLGYDYYETSQAMFAHELKGYGDANGEFVETAFYRAFSGGGVFFLDEVDASAPEALVVLNNAIANKRFDFPVIGNVNAHENFRVIAAGNTRMTGATLEYTARQMQDTSFKNRFFFATVTYDRDVMLDITGGDEEIVNFGADLRRAARETGISQLFSYRQAQDLATLQEACGNDDVYLLRGSVLQEKEIDDAKNLYEHLQDKNNRWAKAMKACIEQMRNEEVW